MNRLKHILHSALVGLPVLLAGCSAMDTDLPADEGEARFTIGITARDEGDINTRVAADSVDTEDGTTGEYISRLYVFIVAQDGTLAWKSLAQELQNDPQAQAGNLRTWTSDLVEIPSGTYDVYAFANLDSYYDEFWASLTGWEVGQQLPAIGGTQYAIDNIVLIGDPASKLNFGEQRFIPMSARLNDVQITPSTTNISIGLDRLVSKIRISISGAAGTNVTGITFGGYADAIGLFADTPMSGNVEYDASRTLTLGQGGITLDTQGNATVADFYVNSNENVLAQGYRVQLTTTEKNGITYSAITQLSQLPRNSIFPLLLQLNDFALRFEAQCWLSPIGAEPTPVQIQPLDADTYRLNIPEGSQFELTLNGINTDNTPATNVSCTWSFDENTVSGLAFENYQPRTTVVKGHVTASAGQEFPLTCEAFWTIGDTQYHRTYTIIIETGSIFNFDFDTSSNAAGNRFGLLWLNTEMLNMSRH